MHKPSLRHGCSDKTKSTLSIILSIVILHFIGFRDTIKSLRVTCVAAGVDERVMEGDRWETTVPCKFPPPVPRGHPKFSRSVLATNSIISYPWCYGANITGWVYC